MQPVNYKNKILWQQTFEYLFISSDEFENGFKSRN